METATKKPIRKHRSNRKARTDKRGKPVSSIATVRDVTQIYPLLDEYEVLPWTYVHAFIGGYAKALRKHMSKQALAPHFYLELPAGQFRRDNADYNPFIFRNGPGAYETMKKRGTPLTPRRSLRNLDHKLLECIFAASIELGVCDDPRFSLIKWDEIRETLPRRTLEAPDPLKIPLVENLYLRPDGRPFVILNNETEEGLFCLFEADCDTESDDSDYTNTIKFKVKAYLHILAERIHTAHFGAETLKVFFIATNEGRADKILNRIEETITEEGFDPDLAQHINVSHTQLYRTLTEEEKPEKPGGHMFTRAWRRARKFKDFYLNKEGEQDGRKTDEDQKSDHRKGADRRRARSAPRREGEAAQGPAVEG